MARIRGSAPIAMTGDPGAAIGAELPTAAERAAMGRACRDRIPRRSLSTLTVTGRDPLRILDEQHAGRVPELVPLRIQRMAEDPFAFFRGTAAIQAADLARDPHSGILVPSSGDAHLANFGFYASPQRTLVFDLNDFDEAAWAPWDWDLKRLVTSVVVEGRVHGRDAPVIEHAAATAVRTYADVMARGVRRTPLARYFDHFDVAAVAESSDRRTRDVLEAARKDARRRTGERAARRLTRRDPDGRIAFVPSPPTMTRSDAEAQARLPDYLTSYIASTEVDVRMLLSHYVARDIARRVVGVGSVGTLCTLVLLEDGDGGTLILQAKQALPSVLVQYGGVAQPGELTARIADGGEGARVVGLQRILQALSDPFLGHLRVAQGDFYVRQFHDMKGGVDTDALEDAVFTRYVQACATMLARAHSQSPNAAAVSGYIGKGRAVRDAILEWSHAYATLSREDYDSFLAANGSASSA